RTISAEQYVLAGTILRSDVPAIMVYDREAPLRLTCGLDARTMRHEQIAPGNDADNLLRGLTLYDRKPAHVLLNHVVRRLTQAVVGIGYHRRSLHHLTNEAVGGFR